MVFVDTSAWYSITVPTDAGHAAALAWYRSYRLPTVTTDYVVDETLTLLRACGESDRAIVFGRRVFDLAELPIRYVGRFELRRAWEIFRDQPLRRWSFTDSPVGPSSSECTLKHVLTFDHHFREFGGLTIAPDVLL